MQKSYFQPIWMEKKSVPSWRNLGQDKDSQEPRAAYHRKSSTRKESPVLLGADFTVKMADLIELEEVKHVEITVSQPTPEEADSLPFVQKIKSILCTNDTRRCGCRCLR